MKHNRYSKALVAIYTVLVVGMPAVVNAQAEKNISLPEAINLSIKSSGQLKIANYKVTEAIAAYHQAKENQLPDLKTSGSYMRLDNPNVNLKVKLGSSSGTSQAKPVTVNELSYAMVNASVPVFSGFRLHYGIESARYLEEAAKLDVQNQKELLIQNTIGAYCNLYKAQKSVELVKKNLKQQDIRVADFANLEKNGVLAYNDLLKARLQQSNTELALMDAENNLKITRVNMSLMLGLPENTELVADSASFQTIGDAGIISEWEGKAFQQRTDIKSLTYHEKASVTAIKSIKGEYFPGLAFTGGYVAANIPGLLTITNAINFGLGLQYNIGSIWKTSAKLDAAKARLSEVQVTENMLADQIRMEVNQAYENYLLSLRKIEVYNKAKEQAAENYRISKNKYENKLMTITDLLDADLAQLQVDLNIAYSKADALFAYKKLQQTAGVLAE